MTHATIIVCLPLSKCRLYHNNFILMFPKFFKNIYFSKIFGNFSDVNCWNFINFAVDNQIYLIIYMKFFL